MPYVPINLYKYSRHELELGGGVSHGRLLKGGEHGTDSKEEEGTRTWMEALRWDGDAQAGDGAALPSSLMCLNQEERYRWLKG